MYVSRAFVFKCVPCWVLSSVCAKSPQIPNATLRHGHLSSSPFIAYTSCSLYHAYLWQELLSKAPHCISNASDSLSHFQSSHSDVHARTQLPAAQILYIPWPPLPALPELTPPQPRLVGKIIFYACYSSPHRETAYERYNKPASLPTFVWASCASPYVFIFVLGWLYFAEEKALKWCFVFKCKITLGRACFVLLQSLIYITCCLWENSKLPKAIRV